MKKLLFCALYLFTLTNSFSQNWGDNQPLKSIIEPYKSRGYINWNPVPNANYIVNIYSKDDNGVYSFIESNSTELTYARLNLNYLVQPNIFYTISVVNSVNGLIIQVGDYSPVAPDYNPFIETCSIDCIGKSYAWTLYLGQQVDGNWSITDPGKVFLRDAYDYIDQSNGFYAPYYQAISITSYSALTISHPYKIITDNGIYGSTPIYLYDHIQINSNTPGGPFYDRQGNLVTNGWLIEKKMDEYDYMRYDLTSLINPSATFCDMNLSGSGGWISTFNTYLDSTSTQQQPTSSPFVPINQIPTTLWCDVAIGSPNSPGDYLDPSEPYDYNDLVYCWMQSGNPVPASVIEVLNCIELLDGFSGVEVIQIDKPIQPIRWDFNDTNQQSDKIKFSELGKGLYKILIFTTNGKVLPVIIEQKSEPGVIMKNRDFVKLRISPNQIQNDVLKFKVCSEKNLHATIRIHNLNGVQLFSESIQVSETSDFTREIPINATDYLYNQIRVTIEFDDNSFLQETAIR